MPSRQFTFGLRRHRLSVIRERWTESCVKFSGFELTE
jgi:hypothetical protein